MDWIKIENHKPRNNSKVWAMACYGDAVLVTVKLVKDRNYVNGTLDNGVVIRRCTKWATYDVIY